MFKKVLLTILLLSALIISSHPVSAQDENGRIYIVQPGDSLSSIASNFNISVDDLITANNITDPNLLTAGQQLVIPEIARVNIGDTYRILIRRMQIPQDIFLKMNHIISPNELYIGDPMIIVQQNIPQLTGIRTTKGETLLELAVKQNTDAWTIAELNGLQGSWDSLPDDTLFSPSGNNTQTSSGLPSAFVSAKIRDLPIKQGGTGVVIVKTLPGVTLSGMLVDRLLHFFPLDDGTQVAFQGVHAALTPGVYPLQIEAILPDGTKQSLEQSVIVQSGNYPTDPLLLVSPDTIDPTTNDAEIEKLNQITAPTTSTRYWQGAFITPSPDFPDCHPSFFGNQRNYLGQGTNESYQSLHAGLDFCGRVGSPIAAAADGSVIFTGMLTVRGNTTIIDHGWGIYTVYCHQSQINVNVGDQVKAGSLIGQVGETGRVTGPHLHWELWVNGVQADPLDWLNQAYP